MKYKLIGIFFFLILFSLFSQDNREILQQVDSLASYMDHDFAAEYTIIEDKASGERSKTVAAVFRRDSLEKYVIIVLEPDISKGQGYLKVEGTLWFYDPESRRYNYTSSSDRFQNTNARNSDFTRSTLSQDYDVVNRQQVQLGVYPCQLLTLEANNNDVTYPKMKIWVDENYLVRKTEDYSLSGQLLRTTAFPSYQQVQGRYLPRQLLMVDALSRERSQITISRVNFNDLPDSTFSKQFLETVSR
ncbi:MAG: outer membrane lipoprotein-sorting protein [Spirochaetaceae bacterium]|jgi:outer membrane lipoprotein-sorting protein|nr:outer membrane lipoprotein-sorting protein [Spirochaetaceae bacterium]